MNGEAIGAQAIGASRPPAPGSGQAGPVPAAMIAARTSAAGAEQRTAAATRP